MWRLSAFIFVFIEPAMFSDINYVGPTFILQM